MTTPQDTSPLQGDGERPNSRSQARRMAIQKGEDPIEAVGEFEAKRKLTAIEEAYVAGSSMGPGTASYLQEELLELKSLRAQRQAWEEERAKYEVAFRERAQLLEERAELESKNATLRGALDSNRSRTDAEVVSLRREIESMGVELAETLQGFDDAKANLESLDEERAKLIGALGRIEAALINAGGPAGLSTEDRARQVIESWASLREENAGLKTNSEGLHTMAVDSVLKEDEAKQESAGLRARVEELKGVIRSAHELVDGSDGGRADNCHGDLEDAERVLRAALSSLGEPQGGEVAP